MSTTNGKESLLRKARWFGAWLLTLAIAFGTGTWTGYEMPRSGVDPQDYIESVFTPYEDGLQHYLEFLDRAHNSVNIAAYSFTHPEIVDKLIELKMTRGVIVRVLLDLSQSHNKSEKAQIERLRQTGIEVVIGKSESHGQIMHHKYTVVDEIWVYSGSWNFSKSANHQANELDFVRSKKRARVFLANWHRMYRFMKAHASQGLACASSCNPKQCQELIRMTTDSLWKEILEYGRWAPSPHNIQSWRFRIEDAATVTLLYDPDRLLPDTDPSGRFCMVGFGILLELLSIAASPHGLKVVASYDCGDTRLDPGKVGPQPLARLRLVKRTGTEVEPLDRQLILDRRTSRLPYDDRPVDASVLAELATVAASFGHKLEFSSDPEEVAWVVALNAKTMFFDMSEPLARNEVGSWIRYSRAEAKRKADGLAAHAMNFPGWLMSIFVKHNWLFRIPGIYQFTQAVYVRSMRGTRTVAWISGPFAVHEDWENTGRMMARLWLTMTSHGVYLHPFGSVITNGKAHELMADHFANPDREHDLWMLVRLGHSDLPPKAWRLTLDQLLVD